MNRKTTPEGGIPTKIDAFLSEHGLTLNPQQKEAVAQVNGHTLLLAVPGSGKTTVILARLGYLIFGLQIPPENILTMSYNVSAVQDLKRRYVAQYGQYAIAEPEFRTINGFCAKVLQAYETLTGRPVFRLMSAERESAQMLRRIIFKLTGAYPTELQLREVQTQLSYARNRMLDADAITRLQAGSLNISVVLEAYTAQKTAQRCMDYDDQLEYAYRALKQHPALLTKFRRRFRYIQVDEAQDASLLQHEIIRLLTDDQTGLLIVGDEDQSIYGFRAAYPDALFSFRTAYPNGTIRTIEENYRSTPEIVAAANRLIEHNRNRHPKKMFTSRPSGTPLRRIILRNRNAQYHWLADYARQPHPQTAILFRNNDSALPLMNLLSAQNIPFYCRPHDALYFTQPLIASVCNGLRFALDPHNEELFRSIYYKFDIPISRATMEQAIILHRKLPKKTLLDLLALLSIGKDAIDVRLRSLQRKLICIAKQNTYDALSMLIRDTSLSRNNDGHNVDFLRFEALLSIAAQNPSPAVFFQKIEELSKTATDGCGTPDLPLILSTVHSAKGQEYDRVILMDVRDGIFPLASDGAPAVSNAQLEEERRLFYVGVTRARNDLWLFDYAAQNKKPAQFIRELLGLSGQKEYPITIPNQKFTAGNRIRHRFLGCGTVVSCDAGTVTIVFDHPNIERRLDLGACIHGKLLQKMEEK